jgi:hypothetical protein
LSPYTKYSNRDYYTEENVDEGLTQYFEEVAMKALNLTKKHGLKNEFKMIKSELEKNRQIQIWQSTEGDYDADPDLTADEDEHNFRLKILAHLQDDKPKTQKMKHQNRRRKGEVAAHKRLYEHAIRRKESMERALRNRDEIYDESRECFHINPKSK